MKNVLTCLFPNILKAFEAKLKVLIILKNAF